MTGNILVFPVRGVAVDNNQDLKREVEVLISSIYDDVDMIDHEFLKLHESELKYHLDELKKIMDKGLANEFGVEEA